MGFDRFGRVCSRFGFYHAHTHAFDTIILDSAGRTTTNTALMKEMQQIQNIYLNDIQLLKKRYNENLCATYFCLKNKIKEMKMYGLKLIGQDIKVPIDM